VAFVSHSSKSEHFQPFSTLSYNAQTALRAQVEATFRLCFRIWPSSVPPSLLTAPFPSPARRSPRSEMQTAVQTISRPALRLSRVNRQSSPVQSHHQSSLETQTPRSAEPPSMETHTARPPAHRARCTRLHTSRSRLVKCGSYQPVCNRCGRGGEGVRLSKV